MLSSAENRVPTTWVGQLSASHMGPVPIWKLWYTLAYGVCCAEAAELLLELNRCPEVLWLYSCHAVPELKSALRLDLCRCPGIPGTVNFWTW